MTISAELAAKVLDADLRNEIQKVSDGGTLSPSVRALLQARVLPDGSAKSRRVANLVTKYAAGARLTVGELAEVREVHPEFAPDAETAAVESPTPDVTSALALTPEPSPAHGDGEITREQLDRWSALYGPAHRQLRRWIERGRERSDPCPLDNPSAMPAWVEKHVDKIRANVREKVNAAAEAARTKTPMLATEDVQADACDKPAQASPVAPSTPTIAPLDLATVGGVEGESVEFFRTVFAAVKKQLADAYAGGRDDQIRSLHSRLEKVGESLRKHEVAAEARAKRLGEYLPKTEVFGEVMQALSTLQLMRDQRKKRTRAELADLPPEILARIDAALDHVGTAEESVLRNLAQLKAPADVLIALAA